MLWPLFTVGLVLLTATSAFGVRLRITLPDEPGLSGCKFRVYAAPGDSALPRLLNELPVPAAGNVDLSLDKGWYAVEISGINARGVIALRRSRFYLDHFKQIDLKAVHVPCDARMREAAVPFGQLAVRRAGIGEDRWRAGDPHGAASQPAALDMVLSPGERYTVSCVAEDAFATLALWRTVQPRVTSIAIAPNNAAPATVTFSDHDAACRVAVERLPDTPDLADVEATFHFPDLTLPLKDAIHRRLLTNRDRAFVGYRLITQARQTLAFNDAGLRFDAKTVLGVGGRLAVTAFAGSVTKHDDKTDSWTDWLVKRLYISDVNGRWVDMAHSSFGFGCRMTYQKKTFDAVSPDDIQIDRHTFNAADVNATATFDYGPHYDIPIVAAGYAKLQSAHFSLPTPASLRGRANAFLQMLEIVRVIDGVNTARPGPAAWHCDWWLNVWGAQATIGDVKGGGTDLVLEFPFECVENFADPFEEPNFHGGDTHYVVHEILHTFGYNHGEEMTRLEIMGSTAYRALRWKAADTGVWPLWSD